MGRSSEAWQEQQDQENESGIDDCEAWFHAVGKSEYLEDELNKRLTAPRVSVATDGKTESYLKPF